MNQPDLSHIHPDEWSWAFDCWHERVAMNLADGATQEIAEYWANEELNRI